MLSTKKILRKYHVRDSDDIVLSIKGMGVKEVLEIFDNEKELKKGKSVSLRLTDGNIPEIVLNRRMIHYTKFINCRFPKADFRWVNFFRCSFACCDLTGAVFIESMLTTVSFLGCQVRDMVLVPHEVSLVHLDDCSDLDKVLKGKRKWENRPGSKSTYLEDTYK